MSAWFLLFLAFVFILPSLAHLAIWTNSDKPASWHQANWSSAGILPDRPAPDNAEIYVFSARTGGLKGAFSSHSWIVLKRKGVSRFERYEVVGWGRPLRKNAYAADAYWYSNRPVIHHQITGKKAEALIPLIDQAIDAYRFADRGDYVIWPGPNSNTFVASILRGIPGLSAAIPSTAVGRDFPSNGDWFGRHENGGLFATFGGYLGLVIGGDTGLEVNFLGLVAGINPNTREILVPSFGGVRF
ncbi:MAG: DUF3750 domain-containing protein [Pseudomonadota bacterium]